MNSRRLTLSLLLMAVACFAVASATAYGPAPKDVTFSKDVAPIFFKNCAECHRPGEAAPMSLLSYKEARPWARSIKE